MGLIYQGEDILPEFFDDDDYMNGESEEYGDGEPHGMNLLPFECKDWTETDLELTWEEGGVRQMPPNVPHDLIVYHWTGGEGSAKQVHRTLRTRETRDKRGLSCHLYIDYDGVVWQYCDLDTMTRHASAVNGRSIGIEMQNHAFVYKDEATEARMQKKFPRGPFVWKMNGRNVRILSFSSAQLETVKTLTHVLCDALGIPKDIPGDAAKIDAATEAQSNGFIFQDRMPKWAWSTYRGVLGHYHVSITGQKLDPGPQIFEELWDSNFSLLTEDDW